MESFLTRWKSALLSVLFFDFVVQFAGILELVLPVVLVCVRVAHVIRVSLGVISFSSMLISIPSELISNAQETTRKRDTEITRQGPNAWKGTRTKRKRSKRIHHD